MSTKIPWCDETLNVTAGCTKCSDGCLNCYAERMAKRQVAMGRARGGDNTAAWVAYSDAINPETGKWSGALALRYDQLDKPLHWKKPRRIFICSMSDLFHPEVPFEFIDKVMAVMALCPQHTFQVLTKRVRRMKEYFIWRNDRHAEPIRKVFYGGETSQRGDKLTEAMQDIIEQFSLHRSKYSLLGSIEHKTRNVHLGVSISNPDELWKVDELKKIPAAVRWLSIEPMLAGIEFAYDRLYCDRDPEEDSPVACIPCLCGKHWENSPIYGTTLNCIDWVVVGGESGPGARPMHPDWPRSIRDQCVAAGVPFYFKQWGAWGIWEPIPNEPQKRLRIIGKSEPLSPKTTLKIFPENAGCTIPFTGWAKVGKKLAGDLLDGKIWKQLPK